MDVIVTEPQMLLFLRRRFSPEDLQTLLDDVKDLIEGGGTKDIIAVYDGVREFIKSRKFSDIDEHGDDNSYWRSYIAYEKPLVAFVKSQLGIK